MIRPNLEAHDNLGVMKLILQVCAGLRGQGTDIAKHNIELPQAEVEMMLLTAAAESKFIFRCALGPGQGRGLCQMDPAAALETFRWLGDGGYAQGSLWTRFTNIWLNLESVPPFMPTVDEVLWHLTHNDAAALALARVYFLRAPAPFPAERPNQAAYWKKHWNKWSKLTIEDALKQWDTCGCDMLMNIGRQLVTLE